MAFVGCHRINGVSAMHSDLMREPCSRSSASIPDNITNKTNGITFRRWLVSPIQSQPILCAKSDKAVLDDPVSELLTRQRLVIQQQFRKVKLHNRSLTRGSRRRLWRPVDASRTIRRADQAASRLAAVIAFSERWRC